MRIQTLHCSVLWRPLRLLALLLLVLLLAKAVQLVLIVPARM